MGTESAGVEVRPQVLDYLRDHKILTLATASATAMPRATTLAYVNEGVLLYVWTRPDTTTARHMEENPVVRFAIDEFVETWRETKGIQGVGEPSVVLNPEELRRATQLFEEKFPALAGSLGTGISFFRISPTELQFIDNSNAPAEGTASGIAFYRELVYSIFRALPERDVQALAARLQTIEVGAGEVIVRQGAPADKFFIIVDGEAEVVREEDGESRRIATLSRGEFFGEIAILRDTPRVATVRAIVPTTLFAMERGSFRSLVAQSIGTTDDFDEVVRQRLQELGSREPS
jgi:uncharacterized protein YhbP (UPF0306 family)